MYRGPRCLIVMGIAALLGSGCKTPVAEFVCVKATDCGEGVCQPSGHCSFTDSVCPSGQRFGEGSGPESERCVALSGDAGLTDAGGTDASTRTPPVANIASVELLCDQTFLELNGSGSEAFDGASIVSYRWTIADGMTGLAIGTFVGNTNEAAPLTSHFLGGTGQAPSVNLLPFSGLWGVRLNARAVSPEGLHFSHEGLALVPGSYTLYFSAASEVAEQGLPALSVLVQGASAYLQQSVDVEVGEFTTHSLGFDVGVGVPVPSNPLLMFSVAKPNEIWIDNIELVHNGLPTLGTQSSLLERDFEQDLEPWIVENSAEEVERTLIPSSLRFDEDFLVHLQVTDSEGVSSPPISIEVSYTLCSAGI